MGGPRKNAKKTRGRPFSHGNPGRPKGSRNKTTLAVTALLDGQAEALTNRAVELALQGDTTALRLCMDRISPPRKQNTVVIDVPEIHSAADIAACSISIWKAACGGLLTMDEGQQAMSLLDSCRRALEITEIDARLRALEEINE